VCKAENDKSAVYCAACGVGLPWARGAPRAAPAAPPPRRFSFSATLATSVADACVVDVFRSGWGDANIQVWWSVVLDNERVGRLRGNLSWGRIFVAPGAHSIAVRSRFAASEEVRLRTAAREKVRLNCTPVVLGRPKLQVVDLVASPEPQIVGYYDDLDRLRLRLKEVGMESSAAALDRAMYGASSGPVVLANTARVLREIDHTNRDDDLGNELRRLLNENSELVSGEA
jgi:hypothetical protein